MQSNKFLVYYNPQLKLQLATDASPYGVGAVLSHVFEDGTERPIQYASQTLNSTQQRYSQIDREAYAIIFGIKKFYQYVFGRKFTLITDNKPIIQIFSPKKGLPTLTATRMQHYAVFLESFDYDIIYKNTKEHANADAMSRLPAEFNNTISIEESDILEINLIETLPVTVEEVGIHTVKDNSVKILLQGLKNGRTVEAKDRFGIDQTEFGLQQNCIMRGIRVYIPITLRKRVLEELHNTHFGVSRMKSMARSYCWWQAIDKNIEKIAENCEICHRNKAEPKKVSHHCWETPNQPFQRVHADFAGPFMGVYFFVLVDAYSKWLEVKIIKNITTDTTIKLCREIFSRFGIPSVFVTDHGVNLLQGNFKIF